MSAKQGEVRLFTLKRKNHLKIDAPVRGLGEAAGTTAEHSPEGVRLSKERRAQRADARSEIYDIKKVPRGGAESEIKTPVVGLAATEKAASAGVSTQAAA